MSKIYDVAIIGVGPAGLSAALYTSRYKLRTLLLGRKFGGWMSFAPKVENYPGFKAISGSELTKKFKEQIEDLEIDRVSEDAVEITLENKTLKNPLENRSKSNGGINKGIFQIKATNDKLYHAKTVIISTGTEKRKLNIKGEEKFLGKGISYCVTCDAALFKGKRVAVIGGRNSAAVAALLLAEYTDNVKIIYRGSELKAMPALIEKVKSNPHIKIIYNAIPVKTGGAEMLEKVTLQKTKNGSKSSKEETINLDGLFIEIGSVPLRIATKGLKLKYNEKGYIKTDKGQCTNIKGIFAAGDATNNTLKQIITAAAEGAVAAHSAFECCMSMKKGD